MWSKSIFDLNNLQFKVKVEAMYRNELLDDIIAMVKLI